MWPNDSSDSALLSQFEREGEDLVRLRLSQPPNSAQAVIERDLAAKWLSKKVQARAQQSHSLSQRQIQAAEEAAEVSRHQLKMSEEAMRLAEKSARHAQQANRNSTIALIATVVSTIVAVIALFK